MRKKIQDWGRDIPGAAKHRLRVGNVIITDFDGMKPQEVLEFAQKKYLWGKAPEESFQGDEPIEPLLYLIGEMVIKKNLPPKPSLLNPFDKIKEPEEFNDLNKRSCLAYANGVVELRELFRGNAEDFCFRAEETVNKIFNYEKENNLQEYVYSLQMGRAIRGLNMMDFVLPPYEEETKEEFIDRQRKFKENVRLNIAGTLPLMTTKGKLKYRNILENLTNPEKLLISFHDELGKEIQKNKELLANAGINPHNVFHVFSESIRELTGRNLEKWDWHGPEYRWDHMMNEMVGKEFTKVFYDNARSLGCEEDFRKFIDAYLGNNNVLKKEKTEKKEKEEKDPIKAFEEEQQTIIKENLKQMDYKHLSAIERTGPSYRKGKDVNEETYATSFGISGVQFGESLPDKERQSVLNLVYDAFKDLGRVLEIEDTDLKLQLDHRQEMRSAFTQNNQSLAIAFGARGKGKAAAHYEPLEHVINITRLRGAGSLAHELGHAFEMALNGITTHNFDEVKKMATMKREKGWDIKTEGLLLDFRYKKLEDISRKDMYDQVVESIKYSAAENMKEVFKYSGSVNLLEFIASVSPLKEEMKKIGEELFEKVKPNLEKHGVLMIDEFTSIEAEKNIYSYVVFGDAFDNICSVENNSRLGKTICAERDKNKERALEFIKENFDQDNEIMAHYLGNACKCFIEAAFVDKAYEWSEKENIPILFKKPEKIDLRTKFYKDAQDFDSGKKPYYTTSTEMFARNFEAVVLKKLEDKGMVNDYLVRKNKSNAITTFEINFLTLKIEEKNRHTFPVGKELERFEKALDNIIRENLTYKKAEEVEYISSHISDKTKKVAEQVIIPDTPIKTEDKEVIENQLQEELEQAIKVREYKKMEQLSLF